MRRCKRFILSVLSIAAWVVLRVSDPLKVSSTTIQSNNREVPCPSNCYKPHCQLVTPARQRTSFNASPHQAE